MFGVIVHLIGVFKFSGKTPLRATAKSFRMKSERMYETRASLDHFFSEVKNCLKYVSLVFSILFGFSSFLIIPDEHFIHVK